MVLLVVLVVLVVFSLSLLLESSGGGVLAGRRIPAQLFDVVTDDATHRVLQDAVIKDLCELRRHFRAIRTYHSHVGISFRPSLFCAT